MLGETVLDIMMERVARVVAHGAVGIIRVGPRARVAHRMRLVVGIVSVSRGTSVVLNASQTLVCLHRRRSIALAPSSEHQ